MNSNTTKIVIVVLVVVAVIFFIGVGVGGGGGLNINVSDTINSAGTRVSSLIPAKTVRTDEMHVNSPGCSVVVPTATAPSATPAPPFIQFGAIGCSIRIDDSDDNVRSLNLQLISGSSAHVELVSNAAENQPMTSKDNLSTGHDPTKFSVFKKGNTLSLSLCSGSCKVQLVP